MTISHFKQQFRFCFIKNHEMLNQNDFPESNFHLNLKFSVCYSNEAKYTSGLHYLLMPTKERQLAVCKRRQNKKTILDSLLHHGTDLTPSASEILFLPVHCTKVITTRNSKSLFDCSFTLAKWVRSIRFGLSIAKILPSDRYLTQGFAPPNPWPALIADRVASEFELVALSIYDVTEFRAIRLELDDICYFQG